MNNDMDFDIKCFGEWPEKGATMISQSMRDDIRKVDRPQEIVLLAELEAVEKERDALQQRLTMAVEEAQSERDKWIAIRAERYTLRDALRPFVTYADALDQAGIPDAAPLAYFPGLGINSPNPTAGDCRRARAALAP